MGASFVIGYFVILPVHPEPALSSCHSPLARMPPDLVNAHDALMKDSALGAYALELTLSAGQDVALETRF